MTKRYLQFLLLIFIALVPIHLRAQAKFAVYGTAGGERTEINQESWTLAGTFGLYYGFAHLGPIAISGDARGDLSRNMNSALFGPRVALTLPALPFKPYVEVLGGVSSYSTQDNGPKNNTSGNYRWVGGIDTTLLPHLDWRVDYSYSAAGITQANITRHPQSLTSGIVIRF
jgi:hypothetical protein